MSPKTHAQKLPMEVNAPPEDLEKEYKVVFSSGCRDFINDLVRQFDFPADKLIHARNRVRNEIDETDTLPVFRQSKARSDASWRIATLPARARDLRLTVGDMSASQTERFEAYMAYKSEDVQALQVDFDDGHCPTWRNQLIGWYNVYRAAHGLMPRASDVAKAPVMLVRPRAWNMVDHTVLVDGKECSGPLLDFAIVAYHNATVLHASGSGPFFFLPKLESASEAQLWDDIFCWTEAKLKLPKGAIRASVQIENILAAFEMDEILFALKDHSLGLNFGIWDYSASIVNMFGSRSDFVIPDRSSYVNMDQPFLRKYLDLLVQTCHKRGAPATSGMAALMLPDGHPEEWAPIIERVAASKRLEVAAGVDGFLFYDMNMVRHLKSLWKEMAPGKTNQLEQLRKEVKVAEKDLLTLPKGGVTRTGLTNNIAIGILFIQSWLHGEGVFSFNGQIEDSATAEISRSQVWQWIRHGVKLEDDSRAVTRTMVFRMVDHFLEDINHDHIAEEEDEWQEHMLEMRNAAELFKQLVTMRDFPEFITSFLNEESAFVSRHEF